MSTFKKIFSSGVLFIAFVVYSTSVYGQSPCASREYTYARQGQKVLGAGPTVGIRPSQLELLASEQDTRWSVLLVYPLHNISCVVVTGTWSKMIKERWPFQPFLFKVQKGDTISRYIKTAYLEGLTSDQKRRFFDRVREKMAQQSPAVLRALGIPSGNIDLISVGATVDLRPFLGSPAFVQRTLILVSRNSIPALRYVNTICAPHAFFLARLAAMYGESTVWIGGNKEGLNTTTHLIEITTSPSGSRSPTWTTFITKAKTWRSCFVSAGDNWHFGSLLLLAESEDPDV